MTTRFSVQSALESRPVLRWPGRTDSWTGIATAPALQSAALILIAAVIAFVVYRPDTFAPFEIIDFSETLPLLKGGSSFVDRTERLIQYYLGHGRAAVLLSAGLAAKWTMFGDWTPGWQLARYAVGLATVIAAWRVLRVFGASRTGASAGAGLLIVAEAAAPGWLRPAVNEPFGMLLMLVAILVATAYQSSKRPALLASVIGVLVMLMLLTKETLIAVTWVPVLIAICRDSSGLLTLPLASRRNLLLVAIVVLSVLAAGSVIAWAMTQSTQAAYSRQFDIGNASLSNAIFGLIPTIIPFIPVPSPGAYVSLAAVVLWLVVLMAGWRSVPKAPAERRHARMLLMLGLALPILRMLVYLPWPLQYPYYSIPYLLGPAILLAMAVTRLMDRGLPSRLFALAACVIILGYSLSIAAAESSRQFATRTLTDALVTALHEFRSTPSEPTRIVTAVPRLKEQEWWGLGPTLARYGGATGRDLPPVSDVPCETARAEMTQRAASTVFVSLRWQCVLPGTPTRSLSSAARRFDVNRLRWMSDTLRADIFSP